MICSCGAFGSRWPFGKGVCTQSRGRGPIKVSLCGVGDLEVPNGLASVVPRASAHFQSPFWDKHMENWRTGHEWILEFVSLWCLQLRAFQASQHTEAMS